MKKGENEALKREMADIEQKRLEEHRNMTSEVGLELAPLMKAQPTGKPRKDEVTGYMMDARLTSTDITKHAAQQTVQPWHKKVSYRQQRSFLQLFKSVTFYFLPKFYLDIIL